MLRSMSLLLLLMVTAVGAVWAQANEPSGTYVFLGDADGASADETSTITLTFAAGRLRFEAVGSGQNVTDGGTYTINGSRITFSLPEIGRSANNQLFSVYGNSLQLPFKVFSEGSGYSRWVKRTGAGASDGDGEGDGDGNQGNDGNGDGNGNGNGNGINPPSDPPSKPIDPTKPDPQKPRQPRNVQPKPEVNPYVGDWVAMGWGWETRFKSSQLGGVTSNKNIMTLTVRHLTRLDFTVDKAGNVRGKGEITYDLDPNLCGVAAVTRQVNEAINMMAQLPDYMEAGQNLAKQADEYFNLRSMVEETSMKSWLDQWVEFASPKQNGNVMQRKPVLNQQWIDANNYKAEDVTDLAKAIWQDRCAAKAPVLLAGGLTCSDLADGPFGSTFWNSTKDLPKVDGIPDVEETFWDKAADWLYNYSKDTLKDLVKDKLKEKTEDYFKQFAKAEEAGKAACSGASTLRAGTSEGGMDAKQAGELAASTAMTMAMGGLPGGAMMQVPGVTQAQYNYKGLENGPESRRYNLKGHIAGGKMFLEMDGDVYDGPKDLVVEYQVNYQTEKKKFPTWSPFEADGAGATLMPQGNMRIIERKVTYTTKDDPSSCTEKNGVKTCKKIKIPHEVNIAKDSYSKTPFAIMHKTGKNRNQTKAWHEYEYFLHAHKVTSPLPETGK